MKIYLPFWNAVERHFPSISTKKINSRISTKFQSDYGRKIGLSKEKSNFISNNQNASRFCYNIFQRVFGLDFVLFSDNFPLKLLICITSALSFENSWIRRCFCSVPMVFMHSVSVSTRFELSDSDQFLYQYQILLWILFAHKEMKKW